MTTGKGWITTEVENDIVSGCFNRGFKTKIFAQNQTGSRAGNNFLQACRLLKLFSTFGVKHFVICRINNVQGNIGTFRSESAIERSVGESLCRVALGTRKQEQCKGEIFGHTIQQ